MKHNIVRPLTLSCLLAAACAQPVDAELGAPDEAATAAAAEPAISRAALTIESAERILDRGEDAKEARRLLSELLADPEISTDERGAATLAMSRAHELLGNSERAIAVLEEEMARHHEDPSWSNKAYRKRLRELLTGFPEAQGIEPRKKVDAAPFARYLGKYFPATQDGAVTTKWFVIGGDKEASDALGTFDVAAGIRAAREEACPLCVNETDVHTHRSRSDWLMIPIAEAQFDEAMLVFYFDLGKNRIPPRYERHLPMPVAEIEALLEDGKSFVVGAERKGAPPTLLIAAPRTALLEDVEKHLAQMDHLPEEPELVDVNMRLRPGEIQGVIRDDYFASARACYEARLAQDERANGRVVLRFVIQPEGGITDIEVDATEGNLASEAFVGCMTTSLQKVRYPESGDEVTVSYPIVFTPE